MRKRGKGLQINLRYNQWFYILFGYLNLTQTLKTLETLLNAMKKAFTACKMQFFCSDLIAY